MPLILQFTSLRCPVVHSCHPCLGPASHKPLTQVLSITVLSHGLHTIELLGILAWSLVHPHALPSTQEYLLPLCLMYAFFLCTSIIYSSDI